MNRQRLLVRSLIGIPVAGLVLLNAAQAWHYFSVQQQTAETEGIVLTLEDAGPRTPNRSITYTFSPLGTEVILEARQEISTSLAQSLQPGDTVGIRYNPNDPSITTLQNDGSAHAIQTLLITAGTLLVFGVLGIGYWRDRRSKNTPIFALQITQQRFLGESDQQKLDLCSHGELQLIINGVNVLEGAPTNEWTLSSAALPLLDTLKQDIALPGNADSPRLVEHCGGPIQRWTCETGLTWNVTHKDGEVTISNIMLFPEYWEATDEEGELLSLTIPFKIYRNAVLNFAEEVYTFFEQHVPRTFNDEHEKEEWTTFWNELTKRLESEKKNAPSAPGATRDVHGKINRS